MSRRVTDELDEKVNTIWQMIYGKVPKGLVSKAAIEREIAEGTDPEKIARKILGRKGQISEVATFIIMLFILSITVTAAWVVSDQVADGLRESTINDSVPASSINAVENVGKMGDAVMLISFAGMVLLLIISAVLLPTNPIFTLLYILGVTLVWFISIPISNGYEQFASQGAFATAAASLPYTNALMSNLPYVTGAVAVLLVIILYGKKLVFE